MYDGINTHNFHVTEYGDKNWENLILFRGFINNHSDYKDKYFNLEFELASKYKKDIYYYSYL